MPRGDKGNYTDKQKRKAEHIAEGYREAGVSAKTAKARAWATVNKDSGGGEKPGGGGYGKPETSAASRAKRAGKASAKRTTARKPAARKSTAGKSAARKSPARQRAKG